MDMDLLHLWKDTYGIRNDALMRYFGVIENYKNHTFNNQNSLIKLTFCVYWKKSMKKIMY